MSGKGRDFNYLYFLGRCPEARDSMLTSQTELYDLWRNSHRYVDAVTPVRRKGPGEPLKVAIGISGFMRNYVQLYRHPTFMAWLANPRYQVDVYISTWDLVGYGACYDHFIDPESKIDVNQIIQQTPNLAKLEVEVYHQVKNTFQECIPDKALLLAEEPGVLARFRSQFYKVYKCQQLIEQSGIDYDIVIRMRADLILPPIKHCNLEKLYPSLVQGCLYVSRDPLHRTDIIGDQFAIGNQLVMNIYCHLYKWLMDPHFVATTPIYRLCERILMHYLKQYKLHIIKMNHRISINRNRTMEGHRSKSRAL